MKNQEELMREIVYIAGPMGDEMWYVAAIAPELSVSLADVAHRNVDKLKSRQDRGVLQGSGDNR